MNANLDQQIADTNKVAYLVLNFLDSPESVEFIPEPDAIPPF
jgi:hypothetical protein